MELLFVCLAAHDLEFRRWIGGVDRRICQTFSASPAEPGELLLGLGLETVTLNARNAREIDAAFEQLLRAKADAFITATDPILLDRREQIVSFAHRHKLPAVYFVRQFAAAGGLLSYGPSISWMYRQAGEYIAQILKGSNPAEMPVLQPTQFELVINLKTAHALGLTVPLTLQSTADEVIE